VHRTVLASGIVIPDDVYDALELPEEDHESPVPRDPAVSPYVRGALWLGTARALTDLSKSEFHRVNRVEGQFQRHRRTTVRATN